MTFDDAKLRMVAMPGGFGPTIERAFTTPPFSNQALVIGTRPPLPARVYEPMNVTNGHRGPNMSGSGYRLAQ